ncbi:MAG TPA: DsbC family protein [Burkholderiales bacterium]
MNLIFSFRKPAPARRLIGPLAASLALLLAGAPAWAQQYSVQAAPAGSAEAGIRDKLAPRLRKGRSIASVMKSPYFGLYEVRVGDQLLYTDAAVSYIFAGPVLDGKSLENLSETRIGELTALDFDKLPLEDSIKMVNGNGSRRLAYFSDPNCPYCKALEHTLTQLKDTTVYVFLYPILSEDSVIKAKALWCAPDRTRAWSDWMRDGRMVSNPGTCDTAALTRNHQLGERVGVQATPTLVLSNGRHVAGALAQADLERAMSEALAAHQVN